jgi:predicted RNA-binding Zn-ribbon protein involved in translation (DUF1610 family)
VGQIIFHCSSCGEKLSAELDEAGCEFECPKCQKTQMVPGAQSKGPAAQTAAGTQAASSPAAATSPGLPVIRIPKRKVVMSSRPEPDEDEDDDFEAEPIGGTGVALFAVALGTAGLLLCCLSMTWMFVSKWWEHPDQWPMALMVFIASFLMGLMGLVIAQLSRLVVKLADRVSRLGADED